MKADRGRKYMKKYDDILLVNLDKLTYAGNLENLKGAESRRRHFISDKCVGIGTFQME